LEAKVDRIWLVSVSSGEARLTRRQIQLRMRTDLSFLAYPAEALGDVLRASFQKGPWQGRHWSKELTPLPVVAGLLCQKIRHMTPVGAA
jgi:hypothetical protein